MCTCLLVRLFVVDEVPVEKLYDEINAETRADLREFIETESDIHSNSVQPTHGTDTLFSTVSLVIIEFP